MILVVACLENLHERRQMEVAHKTDDYKSMILRAIKIALLLATP
ncbi:MAG: hypothetical protein ACI9Y1_002378 [Lentisphaeria bacterium]|jgi:hypothetical protein